MPQPGSDGLTDVYAGSRRRFLGPTLRSPSDLAFVFTRPLHSYDGAVPLRNHLRPCRFPSPHPLPAPPFFVAPSPPTPADCRRSPRAPSPSRTPPPLTSVPLRARRCLVCAHHELRGRTSLRRCTIARAGRRELDSHGTSRSPALVSPSVRSFAFFFLFLMPLECYCIPRRAPCARSL